MARIMNEYSLTYKIEFALKRAKLNKAVGIDGMLKEMLKNKVLIEFV